MKEINITLNFLEPFRVIEWHDKKERNSARFMRGYSFARWHERNEAGVPYITGTLVRSAVIENVEKLLWLHNGEYKGEKCCCGSFKNSKGKISRELGSRRLRKRQTLTWKSEKTDCDSNPCLYCLLLGRYDDAKAETQTDKDSNISSEKFHVKFSNFDSHLKNPMPIDQLADKRIINRIDQESGKAEDFIQIWEIDHEICWQFKGKITFHGKGDNESLLLLLKQAVQITNKISGALCFMEIEDSELKPLDIQSTPDSLYKNIRQESKKIADAFEKQGKSVHLRLFADVVRELGRFDYKTLEFPKGHEDRLGRTTAHFIWDDVKIGKKELRKYLPGIFEKIKEDMSWIFFCRQMGQVLYEYAKINSPEQFSGQRPLGAGQSLHISDDPDTELSKSGIENKLYEILVTGSLTAQTPFFFGWNAAENTKDQTSMRLLVTKDGSLRLPRSVLRGILRRDLKLAFETGCRAELGHNFPCSCPVCSLMRKITIKDSRSEYKRPPQIRHRIRLDHSTATVEQGALFDMEVGPCGVSFPFELRLRSENESIPEKLQTVLYWWTEGKAFLSGGAGTGKGRFALENPAWKSWNMKDDFIDYAQSLGKKAEAENTFQKLCVKNFTWKQENISFSVNTPFITRDPVSSLLYIKNPDNQEGIDAICYKSLYMENGKEEEKYLLKAESMRGILRTAVGRRNNLLNNDHEDCKCLLCRIFGNEHEAGRVRVEDFLIKNQVKEKHIDRVAIDRFTGGAKDKNKFDMMPVIGDHETKLMFEGKIWVSQELDEKECEALNTAIEDIKTGLYPIGGLGNIGLGWINYQPQKHEFSGAKPEILTLNAKSCKPELDKDRTYWPHYFLPFAPKVKVIREQTPPSHVCFNDKYYTGKLVCTLTTKTPLIIPDAEGIDKDDKNHKIYNFFNLNGELCIPGSEIRGMISSIFEALTNSCLRVFDEKKRLSWRMEAKGLDKWKPGKISEKNGELYVEEMEEIRLPVYDNPKLLEQIKSIGKKGYYHTKKVKNKDGKEITKQGQPTRTDSLVNKYAENIRDLLPKDISSIPGFNPEKWFRCYPHGMDSLLVPEKPEKNCNTNKSYTVDKKGSIHFTGPNKLEKKKLESSKKSAAISCIPGNPLEIIHNKVSLDKSMVNSSKLGTVERDRAIPKYEVIADNYVYTMNKRCERVFIHLNKRPKPLKISPLAADKFHQLCLEYKQNASKIPEVFRTIMPENDKLNHGDLIYFSQDEKANVTDIIPVRISRKVDDKVIAQKLPDDLRPCVREILDENLAQKIKKQGLKDIFQHHPEGLCPACTLFGTGFYKSRVSFGFAFPKETEIKMLNNGSPVTLPLLERPRPTWSMPKTDDNSGKEAQVPGRKFYVHHQGWEDVLKKSEESDESKREKKTENNRSVQAVDKGQTFVFEIRFENLRDWELGILMYALNLETGLAHKLGMGKALGFGSAEIQIKGIEPEKQIEPEIIKEKAVNKLKEFWGLKTRQELEKQLIPLFKLLYYIDHEINVKYPVLKNEDKDEKPGYMELKNGEFKPENRQKKLQDSWSFWI